MPIYNVAENQFDSTVKGLGLSSYPYRLHLVKSLRRDSGSVVKFDEIPGFDTITVSKKTDGSFIFNLKYIEPPKVPIRKQIRQWMKKMLGKMINACTLLQNRL